ncbi:hypothetical protein EVAR_62430_1 [Eumeta japonica]|uniref:Uncharacterized protein n=1 Tax=Eumeta variegata TaxID=151549 RepID=A0A4C1Z480_EUMVA|nr:hypothetical protein EVAR_62430_1 [Eumeta japonica]
MSDIEPRQLKVIYAFAGKVASFVKVISLFDSAYRERYVKEGFIIEKEKNGFGIFNDISISLSMSYMHLVVNSVVLELNSKLDQHKIWVLTRSIQLVVNFEHDLAYSKNRENAHFRNQADRGLSSKAMK